MVVYADVLIFLNTIVNYLIINVTMQLSKSQVKLWRQVVAAFVGALFCLYIFLPQYGIVFELSYRAVVASTVIICCTGFSNLKKFVREVLLFYTVSFLYAGIMFAVWFLFKPDSLAINNGIVYFNISPLFLVAATAVSYCVITLFKKFTVRQAQFAKRVKIELSYNENKILLDAMVDTGHSLTDLLSSSPVILVNRRAFIELLGEKDGGEVLSMAGVSNTQIGQRYRLIPYRTVSGSGLLPAVKCDEAHVFVNSNIIKIQRPIVASGPVPLGEDYNAIIGPDLLN
ncbi:MAG: sigma-E processing peptidase SpoIIGA [bacterium]|nr:sigma-E processing peptidase SpoIIGA [bacterium]